MISILAFTVWIAFFDRYDVYTRYTYNRKLKQLEQNRDYFNGEIKKIQTDMEELMTNPHNLEKFARENYLMKRDNEDIFVFVEDSSAVKH